MAVRIFSQEYFKSTKTGQSWFKTLKCLLFNVDAKFKGLYYLKGIFKSHWMDYSPTSHRLDCKKNRATGSNDYSPTSHWLDCKKNRATWLLTDISLAGLQEEQGHMITHRHFVGWIARRTGSHDYSPISHCLDCKKNMVTRLLTDISLTGLQEEQDHVITHQHLIG
jgi:hypothetical protein